jgi:hypothetical protein
MQDGSQRSTKQANSSEFDNCAAADDDDVAHTSQLKWDCDHTCTESLHSGNDAGLVNM